MGKRTYTIIPGFFAQDDGSAIGIPAIPPRFGLLDESPERWTKFVATVKRLNENSDSNTAYKVFFFGRHGEGYHNVGEAKYGTQAWDDHWSKINGDHEIIWGSDPELTPTGVGQAIVAKEAWEIEIPFGIPLPEKLYSSPLTRAMKTCEITFGDIFLDDNRRIIVTENCREENGIHTCDKRRTKSYIESAFPRFEVEPGFTEADLLWNPDIRENKAQVADRARRVLESIFESDQETFISVTAHGGIINGFMETLGRPPYGLPTGGVLPVVIKSTYTA